MKTDLDPYGVIVLLVLVTAAFAPIDSTGVQFTHKRRQWP